MSLCAINLGKNGNKKGCLPIADGKTVAESLKNKDQHAYNKCRRLFAEKDKQEFCMVKEAAILDQKFYNTLNNYFKPIPPESWQKNRTTWLSNFDIKDVFNQYYKLNPRVNHSLGVTSSDFNTACGVFGFNHCKFEPEINKHYFMVINLSKHNEPGTHWVALVMNTNPNSKSFGAKFFDSFGQGAPPSVYKYVSDLKCKIDGSCSAVKSDYDFSAFKLYQNRKRLQTSNTECGIYCLAFIYLCLQNKEKEPEELYKLLPQEFKGIDNHGGQRQTFFIDPAFLKTIK
jgi:hypothetical protein